MKQEPIDWQIMNETDFLKAAEMQIWLSSFASNNPRSPSHVEADCAYDEAVRRGKPWLYQQAWNNAFESCGYELSETDRELAKPK